MTLIEAKAEFSIRYYLWAKSEFEREINKSFPNIRLFRTGPAWQLCQFMQHLDCTSQLALACGLIKRFHPEAAKALGETCAPEEESLRRSLDRFRHNATSTIESRIETARRAGESIRFVSKRKLLNVTAQRFKDAFRNECLESARVLSVDPRLEFQMKCPDGWIISTHFWFGRGESLIAYSHAILSQETFEQRGPRGPYVANLVVAYLISFCSWLGICSQTQWEYLRDDEEVDHACDAVIKFSRCFFEVAPELLKGLEVS